MWLSRDRLICVAIGFIINAILNGNASDCLPDATRVPTSLRRQMNIDGRSTPVQLWVLDWNSAELVTEVFRTLVQEVLGFEAVVAGRGTGSRSMQRALTGCISPNDDNVPCTVHASSSNYHIGFEAWENTFIHVHTNLQNEFPERANELIGEVGYSGHEGIFLPDRVQSHGLITAGIALDHYRSYNSSWHSPWTYFSPLNSINNSALLPCSSIANFNDMVKMANYLHWTQDRVGVANGAARCWQGHWFFSPACRATPSTCIPVLLPAIRSHLLPQFMQQAFWNSMSFAFVVWKTRAHWSLGSASHNMLFYWWMPDESLIKERPHIISFAQHDASEYAKGRYSSAIGVDKLWKMGWRGLKDVSREVYDMGRQLQLSLAIIQSMLLKLTLGKSIREVACEWIRQNNAIWNQWITDPRVCGNGHGMVTDSSEFTTSFESARRCKVCSPGRVSVHFQTQNHLSTRACDPCSVGKFSMAYAATECALCSPGLFTGLAMQTHCVRCGEGKYQYSPGSTSCLACNASFITRFQGASESNNCGCPAGSRYDERKGQCETCLEGVLCPGGFFMGQSGIDMSPLLRPGFMALPEKPLSVYTCVNPDENCACFRSPFPAVAHNMSYCQDRAKEAPGMCAIGVKLSPRCAACENGYHDSKGQGCEQCMSGSFYIVLSVAAAGFVQCVLLLYIYIRFNMPQNAGYVVLGCVLIALQLFTSTGRVKLLWPTELSWMWSASDWFTPTRFLGLFGFYPECIAGNSFAARLLYNATTPLMVLCMFLPLALLYRLCGFRLYRHRVLNTIGLLFGNFFVGISGMTLTMFTYDEMPNGLFMTKEFPELELGSDDWCRAMPVSLLACLIYCVTFLVYCARVAFIAPKQAANNPKFVKQYMFMFGIMRPECWWWLLVSLSYGFSVNAIQTLSSSVHFKLYGCIFVGIAFVAFEIHVLPFKFMMCNIVDLVLKSGVFVIWMLCLPLIEHHESLDLPSLHRACRYCILGALSFVSIFAGIALLRWALGLLKPPGVVRGENLKRAMQSRHIFVALDLLKERELLARLSLLGDEDLNKLSRCTSMVASALLGLQPSAHLVHQRVMPGVSFQVWDPSRTEQTVIAATLSGDHEKSLLNNMKTRVQLETLNRLIGEHVCTMNALGKPFYETDKFGGSWEDGRIKYLLSFSKHMAKRFFNKVLTYSSANHNKNASLLGLHNKRLNMIEFGCAVTDLLGDEAECLQLDQLFKLLDPDKDGYVCMDDFVINIMSASQLRTSYVDVDLSNHPLAAEHHDTGVKTLLKRCVSGVKAMSGSFLSSSRSGSLSVSDERMEDIDIRESSWSCDAFRCESLEVPGYVSEDRQSLT